MPFPAILLWGAAAAVAAVGVKKGIDAYNDFDDAKSIGERAERELKESQESLDKGRKKTARELEELGQLKIQVFSNQIKYIVDVIKRRAELKGGSRSKSSLKDFNEDFTIEDLQECENMVEELSLSDVASAGVAGAAAGTLLAMGAYGAVGTLATASTGAAIGSLSGVAATNATLAWLGGGSLAAGGFGMAGGMIALGGIVAAPILAIGGFVMASKAEEALEDARDYRSKVDEAVSQMKLLKTELRAIVRAKLELESTIEELVKRFESVKVDEYADDNNFKKMLILGKSLKEALNVPIMNEEGKCYDNIQATCSGFMEYTSRYVGA